MLKIYNTLTRKKEEFKSIQKGKVGMYSCGPTVYWFAHVGNFRSYVFSDILKRILIYNGYKIDHVINITDVGHLTSDSDSGNDKLEESAKKEKKSAKEISEFYEAEFWKDFKKLNLIEPTFKPKATEHIKEQIELIKTLEQKGFTYKTSDGIYYDTSKFKDYGKLSRKKIEDLQGGKRIKLGEKENKTDFALWKFSSPKENRQQEWDSPWGVGFPGWHIECSAMSSKYLGQQFDIHTGGEDHIPIHHENEIAQSEAAFEKVPWVKYWMHGAFLNIRKPRTYNLDLPAGTVKMSKSSGKIKTISQLEFEGIDPLAYKYFTYTAHYRKPLTWSEESIQGAVDSYKKLKNSISKIVDDSQTNEEYLKKFKEKINDDLDMPGALAVLWKFIRDTNAKGKIATIKKMDEVFGLKLLEKNEIEIPNEIKTLLEERNSARQSKDWKKSDEIRDKIKELGFEVKDTKEGQEIMKI